MKKRMTAIVCKEIGSNKTFLKYRNIRGDETGQRNFLNFAKNIEGAKHVNFYNSATKQFIEQVKI